MNNFKWGDKIICSGLDEFIIIYIHDTTRVKYIEVCNEYYRFEIHEKDWDKVKRLPRFGELIEVRDNPDEKWNSRYFICM